MLNISPNSVRGQIDLSKYRSFQISAQNDSTKYIRYTLLGGSLAIFLAMFLPWTQNVRSEGYVTTLRPEQRPQSIPSIIDGRLEKWMVREGSIVEKGDTIAFISET